MNVEPSSHCSLVVESKLQYSAAAAAEKGWEVALMVGSVPESVVTLNITAVQ